MSASLERRQFIKLASLLTGGASAVTAALTPALAQADRKSTRLNSSHWE